MQGVCKFFEAKKGFGFIKPNDGGEDLFVHHTGIVANGFRALEMGDDVEFDVEQSARGPRAVNVRKI